MILLLVVVLANCTPTPAAAVVDDGGCRCFDFGLPLWLSLPVAGLWQEVSRVEAKIQIWNNIGGYWHTGPIH